MRGGKQQAWQAVQADVPTAMVAADDGDAIGLEARTEAEARRAERAETGKRQAVPAARPGVGAAAADAGGAAEVAVAAPARGRARGLDARPDAPRVRRMGRGKAKAPAVRGADVLAWAAAHRAAQGL